MEMVFNLCIDIFMVTYGSRATGNAFPFDVVRRATFPSGDARDSEHTCNPTRTREQVELSSVLFERTNTAITHATHLIMRASAPLACFSLF